MRKRLNLTTLELAVVLFVAVIAAAFWVTQATGCGTVTVRYNSSGKETDKSN